MGMDTNSIPNLLEVDNDTIKMTAQNVAYVNSSVLVPIGVVIAFLKSYTNTPTLPDGFVECNGQVLDDADSPYDTQTIPDLNGGNRFLRGNSTSGGTGGAENHTHTVELDQQSYDPGVQGYNNTSSLITTSSADSKPPYYEVVWVMRIK